MIKKIGRTFLLLSLGFGIGGFISSFRTEGYSNVSLLFILIAVVALGFLVISEYLS